jgi:DNA-binding SARP family transcriptional activator/predicted ATPase
MAILKAELMGPPEIRINGEIINFPYKKVEALLYYLLVNKKIKRAKIAFLLWGDMPEDNAKKNLRNALYHLKKLIGNDIIITSDKFTIELIEKYKIDIDLELLLKEDMKNLLNLYRGEFLQDFFVNDCLEFNNWLFEQKNYYQNVYINLLKEAINDSKKRGNSDKIIDYLNLLIKIDEFNELAYRELMKIYVENGLTAKAIELYKHLKDRLNSELSITPDSDTVKLFEEIYTDKVELNKSSNDFIGREKELSILINNINSFIYGQTASSMLIVGEAGIGKTSLIKKALSSIDLRNSLILNTNCYSAEEHFIFKPWKIILEQLKKEINLDIFDKSIPWKKIVSYIFPSFLSKENIKLTDEFLNFESIQHQSAVDVLNYLLTEVAKKRKLILVFDDLQWCDEKSLELLKLLIYNNRNTNILVLSASRNERKDKLEEFFPTLRRYGYLKEIRLERLDIIELEKFARKKLPGYKFTRDLIKRIYQETEGNIFFLVESLKLLKRNKENDKKLSNFMTNKSRDILRERTLLVSKEALKILNIISIPFDHIEYKLLLKLSGKKEAELIDILDELENHYLIEEKHLPDLSSFYSFTHTKIRDYIYQNLSYSRRRLLHSKIASIIEEELNQGVENRDYYLRLIYHYKRANNKQKQLKYLILLADIYFHSSHELFPLINDEKLKKNKIINLNQEESQRHLQEIESLLIKVKNEGKGKEIDKMEIKFINMTALYQIAQGDYKAALDSLKKMIEKAKKFNEQESMIEAYQQMAGIAIQKEDIELIEYSGKNLYKTSDIINNKLKKATALRFLGISNLYKRKYRAAEKMFDCALSIFKEIESDKKKYTLGVAAIYNYLGEIKRHKGMYREALNYYERCIGLCEAQNIKCGLGVFYTNAGQVYFELKEYNKAEFNFIKALDIFSQLKTIWGYATIANSFLTLIFIEKNKYREALNFLLTAEKILEKHYKRYWLGILLRIKVIISKKMKENNELAKTFSNYIDVNNRDFVLQALEIFREIGAPYEIDLMEKETI